jgi:hypothetical protein
MCLSLQGYFQESIISNQQNYLSNMILIVLAGIFLAFLYFLYCIYIEFQLNQLRKRILLIVIIKLNLNLKTK